MKLQLQQQKILITRNEPKASEFAREINQYGGQALVAPLIKISYTPKEEHAKLLRYLVEYEWLFFTSANGVHCFFKALEEHQALERVKHCKIAAVGPKTNQALQALGYEADFMPSLYNAETMAPEFLDKYHPAKPVLFIRGQLSGTVLNEAFLKKALPFDCIEVYATVTNQEMKQSLNQILTHEKIDYITFTSPSTVDAFMDLSNDAAAFLHHKIVCIGTTTEKRAKECGFQRILVPEAFTIEGMMELVHKDISQEGSD